MIDFKKLKIIEELGIGMFGTTYLVKYENNKLYALKIEHIMDYDKRKILNHQLYKEFELFYYIDTLSPDDQLFFTKMHGYNIENNCKHIQIRPNKVDLNDKNNPFYQKMKRLDESPLCLKTLMDYKGKTTLYNFLVSNKNIPVKLIYSFMLQVSKIIMILYNGEYSHNDLHDKNIMVMKTDKEFFMFEGEKIPYCGYQLSAIDYGAVLHKKFKINYIDYRKKFLIDRNKWLYNELIFWTDYIYENYANLSNIETQKDLFSFIKYCKKAQNYILWKGKTNDYIEFNKIILNKHIRFFKTNSKKYIKLFPKSLVLINSVIDNRKKIENIADFVRDKENEWDFWFAYNKTIDEFRLKYPKLYIKYLKLTDYYDYLIPHKDVLKILETNNSKDLIKLYINLIKLN